MITTRTVITCSNCDNRIESDDRKRAICRASQFGWHLSVEDLHRTVDLCPTCWADRTNRPSAALKALADELSAEEYLQEAVRGYQVP